MQDRGCVASGSGAFVSVRSGAAAAHPDSLRQGIDAELVSLESIVEAAGEDDEPSTGKENGGHLGQAFYDRLSKRLGDRLLECGDRVPVVTGTPPSSSGVKPLEVRS